MLRLNLEINNLTTSRVDKKFLEKVTKKVFKEANIKEKIVISLVFVGENKIRRLNKQYRGKNKITDVLSFSFTPYRVGRGTGFRDKRFAEPRADVLRLGEIFICFPQAKKQAEQAGHSLKNELAILLTHAMLHLLGYNHGKGIAKAQEKIIKKATKYE